MKYSYEYKRMYVALDRQGKWPETPEGIQKENFRKMIRGWTRIENSCLSEALRHKNQNNELFNSNIGVRKTGYISNPAAYEAYQKTKEYTLNGEYLPPLIFLATAAKCICRSEICLYIPGIM